MGRNLRAVTFCGLLIDAGLLVVEADVFLALGLLKYLSLLRLFLQQIVNMNSPKIHQTLFLIFAVLSPPSSTGHFIQLVDHDRVEVPASSAGEDFHRPAEGNAAAEVLGVKSSVFEELKLSLVAVVDVLLCLLNLLLLLLEGRGQTAETVQKLLLSQLVVLEQTVQLEKPVALFSSEDALSELHHAVHLLVLQAHAPHQVFLHHQSPLKYAHSPRPLLPLPLLKRHVLVSLLLPSLEALLSEIRSFLLLLGKSAGSHQGLLILVFVQIFSVFHRKIQDGCEELSSALAVERTL